MIAKAMRMGRYFRIRLGGLGGVESSSVIAPDHLRSFESLALYSTAGRLYSVRRNNSVAKNIVTTVKTIKNAKSPATAMRPVFLSRRPLNACTA